MMLTHLDLFTGIGGFALAARWVGGIRTIGFCDNEKYARQVLAKNFKGIPIYEDVRELHPDVIVPRDGRIDFLTCGFPRRWRDGSWEEGIPRVTTGQKNRVSRLKGLGNSVVPQCAMIPLMRLKEILL